MKKSTALVVTALAWQAGIPGHATPGMLDEEIAITATRIPTDTLDVVGNIAMLDARRIKLTAATHVNEIGSQLAGTWISRGSGQEHLTAIRSPVLTGPGACGSFLMLEDSIPIRPVGFCNVNQLMEVPTELAESIEVLRGPANAMFGSNGLHGTINTLLPEPKYRSGQRSRGARQDFSAATELGPDGYIRGRLGWNGQLAEQPVAAGIVGNRYDGFRDSSGYRQAKGFIKTRRVLSSGELDISFSGSYLNQQTAGFVLGQDAYRDPDVRYTNPNPDAYRKADSQRLSVRWSPAGNRPESTLSVTGFARRSDMEFLQHFLPGQPVEKNGQISGGLMVSKRHRWDSGSQITMGVDLETSSGYLEEFQAGEVDSDSAFLRETRPPGQHYDYRVSSYLLAPYAQLDLVLTDALRVVAGLRFDYLVYEYDNRMLTGNGRDDGTTCGFGGCLFNRPADRTDQFRNLAPNLGLIYRFNPAMAGYVTLTRGFRAPQAAELYRLQSDQTVADLDSEEIDSLEAGIRRNSRHLRVELAAFAMRKRNFIFKDADGFNVSDGKSSHAGIELQLETRLDNGFFASAAGSYARHEYRFSRDVARGESIRSGNEIDTAPRTLASARIGFENRYGLVELEGVHQGAYFLNAANTARYGGHNLLNLRTLWHATEDWMFALRINNLADTWTADRADFSFGNYRYFPGRDREFFLQIGYRTL